MTKIFVSGYTLSYTQCSNFNHNNINTSTMIGLLSNFYRFACDCMVKRDKMINIINNYKHVVQYVHMGEVYNIKVYNVITLMSDDSQQAYTAIS